MKRLKYGYSKIFIILLILDTVCTGKTTVTMIRESGLTSAARLKHCKIPLADGNTVYQMMDVSGEEHVTLLPDSVVTGSGGVVHVACRDSSMRSSWFAQDYMVCYDGHWYPPDNHCIRHCPPLNLLNSLIECTLNGEPVSCQESVPPRTVASKSCKPGYADAKSADSKNICLETGEWSLEFVDCYISCEGIDKTYKSNDTDLMELVSSPWTAGVYRWDNLTGNFVFVCSASIVGTDLIVTAAHCVQENGTSLRPDLVRVAVGKSCAIWDDEHDVYTQTLEVNQVTNDAFHALVAFGYDGVLEMLKSMSFLLLSERIEFNSFVRPICADTEAHSNNIRYLNGTVTGWDETDNKRVSYKTTFYTNADCKAMISKLGEHDEEFQNEVKKFGRYCTDRLFPRYFLGAGAVFFNEVLQVDVSIGVLTSMHKSFSIFVGPRSEDAIKDMMRFYSHLIDKNH